MVIYCSFALKINLTFSFEKSDKNFMEWNNLFSTGGVFVIKEFDAAIHPELVKDIISLAYLGSNYIRNDQNYLMNYFKGEYATLPYIDFTKVFIAQAEEDRCRKNIIKLTFMCVKDYKNNVFEVSIIFT